MFKKYSSVIIIILITTVTLIIGNSCGKKSTHTYLSTADTSTIIIPPPPPPLPSVGTKRLLALGDSYTIGQSVMVFERFPNQTIDLLKAAGADMKYPAEIIAQTGWTTQHLLNGITNANPQPTTPCDLVTLLIGVNNQYQHLDTAQYRTQFIQCVNKAIQYSGNRKERVFVLSIPDYGATPFGANNATQIGLEIDRFNFINKQVCLQMNIDYTDITPSTRMAISNPNLVASDGLHPSGIEYAKWAAMLKAKMLALVQ
jgi:lysophospholipase L1-like esterase